MKTRVRPKVATRQDRIPVYALMGSPYGNRQAKLGKTVDWCAACEQRRREADELSKWKLADPGNNTPPYDVRCGFRVKATIKVRKPTPQHCATCKCDAEYVETEVQKTKWLPGHNERHGIPWLTMKRFLRTFGACFMEYWTTGSSVGNASYVTRRYDYAQRKYEDKTSVVKRIRRTGPTRCYAFAFMRDARRFVRRRLAAWVKGPGRPYRQRWDDREFAARMELAFFEWARFSQTRFVGRYYRE